MNEALRGPLAALVHVESSLSVSAIVESEAFVPFVVIHPGVSFVNYAVIQHVAVPFDRMRIDQNDLVVRYFLFD